MVDQAASPSRRHLLAFCSSDEPTRRMILGLLGCSPAFVLSGCSSRPRTIRYRLTLFVETPEGERIGTAVVEARDTYNDGYFKNLGNVVRTELRGEATVVDLGSRGLLFCLLRGDPTRPKSPQANPTSLPAWYYKQRIDGVTPMGSLYDELNKTRPKMEIPLDALPFLVRFGDPKESATIDRVDPLNMAASFGDGVRLMRAVMEITDDSITHGIINQLPWLATGWPVKQVYPASGPVADFKPERLMLHNAFWSNFD